MSDAANERLRLFVALDLPAAARASLATWADGAAPTDVRRVAAESLHVTIAFLGDCSRDDASAAGALLVAVARPVGTLRTAGALWLAPRRPGVLAPRRPGVLAVALEHDAALLHLHRDLAGALAAAIGHEPDRRRLLAHVTIGRLRRGAPPPAPVVPIPPALEFVPEALTLYRSDTSTRGTGYAPLASVALPS